MNNRGDISMPSREKLKEKVIVMVRLVTIPVALVARSITPSASQGATIERYSDAEMGCDIIFSGLIETGDEAKLKGAVYQTL